MSRYRKGDVILARIRISERGMAKIRPAVVIATVGEDLLLYPISPTPSWDQPSIPLSLNDFIEGGLDILDDSHILTGQAVKISMSEVLGKKGRLSGPAMEILPTLTGP